MSRPKHSLNVTEQERQRICELYVQGIKVVDIVRRTKRSESVVYRAVRGLKRPRLRPKSQVTRRNKLILARRREGLSYGAIAKRFKITASLACEIVRKAMGKR